MKKRVIKMIKDIYKHLEVKINPKMYKVLKLRKVQIKISSFKLKRIEIK